MYLKTMHLENVGPIKQLDLTMPFDGETPKPIVIVGGNGSGKSIVLSFIVNFLLLAKQQFYEDAEVTQGKVFKLRSPGYITFGEKHYYAHLTFEQGFEYEEWQLLSAKQDFEKQFEYKPLHASWDKIDATESSAILMPQFQNTATKAILEKALDENLMLYFPSDRFEEPAWLNEENLKHRAAISPSKHIKGITNRKIIADRALSPLVTWFYDVVFDSWVQELRSVTVPVAAGSNTHPMPVFISMPGLNTALIGTIALLLELTFQNKGSYKAQINVGPKNQRQIGVSFLSETKTVLQIPNIFSLSTGESLLLVLFCSILRDFDLVRKEPKTPEDIRGIAIIDEIDLHLHVDLQRKVLPQLLKMFPKVQFIITTHSPLFLIGMDEQFGETGYEVYELPTGNKISSQRFAEFDKAYDAYKKTKLHESEIDKIVKGLEKPVLLTEGKSDKMILDTAWSKLYPDRSMPFQIVSSGIESDESTRSGGADPLRRTLEFVSTLVTFPIVGLFDNDKEGNQQFISLGKTFDSSSPSVRKHKTKNICGILLPVPAARKNFVSVNNPTHRYLQIEHYFSNERLKSFNKMGEPILTGSEVFEIIGDKVILAEKVSSLDAAEFSNFKELFEQVEMLLTSKPNVGPA